MQITFFLAAHKKLVTVFLILVCIIFLSNCIADSKKTGIRGEAYAGAHTCRKCHEQIYDSYIQTAHFNTSSKLLPVEVKAAFENGKNVSAAAIGSEEAINASVAATTRYLESGNYYKLRNATFSYAVGDIGKYIKNLNAFVSGTNIFVITDFTGFDPEVNIDKSNGGYPSRSIEYIPYPTPRIITFGLNFSL